MKEKLKKKLKYLLYLFITLISLFIIGSLIANLTTVFSTASRVYEIEELDKNENYDLIIVLGCGVRRDGTPSSMLNDRINTAVIVSEIYPNTPVLMSGDHTSESYDEVNTMSNYAVERGMDENIVIRDGYGVCTYDSIKRAIEIYDAKKVLIITHRYHTYRAVFTALCEDCDAYAACADLRSYWGKGYIWNPLREIFARDKDFLINILKISPKYGFELSPDQC